VAQVVAAREEGEMAAGPMAAVVTPAKVGKTEGAAGAGAAPMVPSVAHVAMAMLVRVVAT